MKTYCFKLYRSKRTRKLGKAINTAGMIYNHLIALHKRYYKMFNKSLSAYKIKKHITKLKRLNKYSYWKELDAQAIQDIAERIDRAYKLFFRSLKHKIKSAPPSFKKIKKYKSFTLKQAGYKIVKDNCIIIMGQEYKFHKSRNIEGKIKTLTVKRDSLGDVYMYIACEQEQKEIKARTGKSVGYDFGLKKFLIASDEYDIEAPSFFMRNIKELKAASCSLSKKEKGSNNRERARLALARMHKKIANCRKDFHFKLAKELCKKYAVICIEDLNIKAMQKIWGRKISDLGHGRFVDILKYQALVFGTNVIKIPRFYPSSKTCFDCGYVIDELPLTVRSWACPSCGSIHDRDKNAAMNIHKVGTSTLLGEAI